MSNEDRKGIVNNLPQALWSNNQDLARRSLQISFIQRLIDGTLGDDIFLLCDQQDKYFEHIVRPYRKFVQMQDCNDGFLPSEATEILHSQRKSAGNLAIAPTPITNNYIDFVFSNANDLYLAIASLLPCSKLYGFLTQELCKMNSPRYDYWIGRHPPDKSERSIVLLESLMACYQGNAVTHLEKVFRTGLEHEIAFFLQFDDLI